MAVTVPADRVERRVPAGASPLRTRSPMLSEQNEAYGGHLDHSFRRLSGWPNGKAPGRYRGRIPGGPAGPRRFDSFAGRMGSWCNWKHAALAKRRRGSNPLESTAAVAALRRGCRVTTRRRRLAGLSLTRPAAFSDRLCIGQLTS